MAFRTLIDTENLGAHLADARWIVIDCRFQLSDPAWGEEEYRTSHIPGAVYAHLNNDLSAPLTGTNGRHPLPEPSALIQTLIRLGVQGGMQVVAYDADNGMFASRLWWLLKWIGHDEVAVLDGGFRKWTAERRQVASGIDVRPAGLLTGTVRSDMTADAGDVARIVGMRDRLLLDARAPER
ncbi:MAG TPA: rhodanese-like domain-containing protein, partial [Vicinamibacterales bacterium]|nr:rhodanese-like domain-containing protein [Vicinamibacterales bacterium]